MLVRRSTLIMPAHERRFVEKAHTRGADAIMLDLEDSVAPRMKEAARADLPEAVRLAGLGGADVLVRINHPWELAYRDLEAAVIPGVTGIFLPKVESPEDVYAIDHFIAYHEQKQGLPTRSLQLALSIESAKGLERDREIARASTRLVAITSGIEDLAKDLDVELTEDAWELFYTKARIIITARAAGLVPLGLLGRISDYKDLDGFRKSAMRARQLGYVGSGCIHPSQVPILNEVFSPSQSQLSWARSVVEANAAAEAENKGSFGLNGQMIDVPVVQRAEQFLQRERIIAERERTKGV